MKVWALCDFSSNYAWALQVYLGKGRNYTSEKKHDMRVVLDLLERLKEHTM